MSTREIQPPSLLDLQINNNGGEEEEGGGVHREGLLNIFNEIIGALRKVLIDIDEGEHLRGLEALQRTTDVVVTHSDALGLTTDDSPRIIHKEAFWFNLNQCWLYSLSRCDKKSGLRAEHYALLKDSVREWADVLQPFGLVDYEMGFWEAQILESINAAMSQVEED